MALSAVDRELLDRCLAGKPRAWEDFVDRFLGLVIHVINHSAQTRGYKLTSQDTEDLAADVFLAIVINDFSVLRKFRGASSLATYLTVVARRVVVRELLKRKNGHDAHEHHDDHAETNHSSVEQRMMDREEIERLLEGLEGSEAEVVRLFHLEGKSYSEISSATNVPENSIGPTLTRARAKLRASATS